MKKLTTEEFIRKSKIKHLDLYDYSLVEYKNCDTKVKIICKNNHIFEQTPKLHLIGNGCIYCSGKKKLTTEEFIENAIKIHDYKYDYSLVEYENCDKKVKIICKYHGIFEQTPNNHISNKNGCPKCHNLNLTDEEIIDKFNKVHNFKYDYSLSKFDKSYKKIKIICPEHGIFEQLMYCHTAGQGCKKCANNVRFTNEEFIKISNKIHNFKYDYSLVDYKNYNTKVKIICPIHGVFEQVSNYHMQGAGCKRCIFSKNEKKISDILDNLEIKYEIQKRFDNCKDKRTLPFDFYLSKYECCIEYDGEQHFKIIDVWGGIESYNNRIEHDTIKNLYCEQNKIKLLRINYLDDLERKLISFLKNENIII